MTQRLASTKTFAVSALVVALLSTPVWAHKGEHGEGYEPHQKMEKRFDRMAQRLQLSDEQRTEIKRIMEQARAAHEPMKGQMKQTREQMRALIDSDTFDEQQAKDIAQQSAERRASMMVERAKTMHAMRQVLTEEQREAFRQMHQQRMEKWQHRMEDKDQ